MTHSTYRAGFTGNRRGAPLFYSVMEAGFRGEAWILCPPLLEEAVAAHDTLRNFARALAAKPARVYRFDYEGTGDSGGESAQMSLEAWAEDAVVIAELAARDGASIVRLLGIRGGALVAAIAAASAVVTDLQVINPVLAGEAHLQELLRLNLTTQLVAYDKVLRNREQLIEMALEGGTVNLQGWEVSGPFVRSLRAADFGQLTAKLAVPVRTVAAPQSSSFWLDPRMVDFDQEGLQSALSAI